MEAAVSSHPRSFEKNRYVYPVVSRRAKGLSVGVNMNPDKFCNFDCVYCQVDRTTPGADARVDTAVLREELVAMLGLHQSGELWKIPPFSETPAAIHRLNDIALSGDGEPTLCANFSAVCETIDALRHEAGRPAFKLVLITNATALHRPEVAKGLARFGPEDEIWAKLDAGTDAYLQKIDRTGLSLEPILRNILEVGRARPVVIQSLFLEYKGEGPSGAEIDAYVGRLQALAAAGCRIKLVQVYSVARRTTDPDAKALDKARLEQIAAKVRKAGLNAEVY